MAKVIKLTDNSDTTLLPITDASYVQIISYSGVAKSVADVIFENEKVTAAAINDLDDRINNYSTPFATISYQSDSINNGGVISGVVKNNMNRTSGNVTTIRTVNEIEQSVGGTGTARTILRYETPLINVAKGSLSADSLISDWHTVSNFPEPSLDTMNNNYYDPVKNNTKKANIYGTDPTNVAYAPMIDGNNYCDVSDSTYEMYFFNTNKLRNYLTAYARIDVGLPRLKEIKSDNIWQWGPSSMSYADNTLTLKKDSISFSKYSTDFNHLASQVWPSTKITYNKINVENIVVVQNSYQYKQGEPSTIDVVKSLELGYNHIDVKTNDTINVSIQQSQSTFNHSTYAEKFYETSDKRLKTYISPIAYDPDGIGIYTFIKNNYNSYSYGFIAQNVAETHPELVSENNDTSYLSVDYDSTLSLLLAKALNRIDELEKKVAELEKNNK